MTTPHYAKGLRISSVRAAKPFVTEKKYDSLPHMFNLKCQWSKDELKALSIKIMNNLKKCPDVALVL